MGEVEVVGSGRYERRVFLGWIFFGNFSPELFFLGLLGGGFWGWVRRCEGWKFLGGCGGMSGKVTARADENPDPLQVPALQGRAEE